MNIGQGVMLSLAERAMGATVTENTSRAVGAARVGRPPGFRHPGSRGASLRTAGYVEASRGCKHRCRHCPVVPVYNGRFRIVPREIVLADVRQQAAAGARHISFGDPDFFDGPNSCAPHRRGGARGVSRAYLRYDVTIKVEHLLVHAKLLPVKQTGCLFVTTAVESVDDRVLAILDKDHTREDFFQVVRLFDEVGLSLCNLRGVHAVDSYLDLLKVTRLSPARNWRGFAPWWRASSTNAATFVRLPGI
jgi:radical SAM superfamily enzyme YgiQ (UPF0313 family)